jgi:hypothetical protein
MSHFSRNHGARVAHLEWLPLGFALVLLLTLACALALAAGIADAAGHAKITVSTGDSAQVSEIRIDDEGIRVSPAAGGRLSHRGVISVDGRPLVIKRHAVELGGLDDSLGVVSVRTDSDNEIVEFFKDVHVQKGQQAGQVVAILGNVKNDGVIGGDCVSVLGSIVQGDSAVIQGEAVSVGGSIHTEARGSRIEGQTVSIGFLPFANFALPSVTLLLIFGLISFFVFVLLSALTARLFSERMVRIADAISNRTFMSLVVGLVSLPLAIMLGLLLLVTVIGIPLAFLLPFLYVLAAFVGFTAAAYVLGSRLLGRTPSASGGMLGPIAAGTGFVTLFYAVGVPLMAHEGAGRVFGLGFIVLWLVIGTVCWMLGLGALLVTRIGQTPPGEAASAPFTPSTPTPPYAPPSPAPSPGAPSA